MIKANQVRTGDRIGIRSNGRSYTRTVQNRGKDYVVIEIGGQTKVVMENQITSHIKVGWK